MKKLLLLILFLFSTHLLAASGYSIAAGQTLWVGEYGICVIITNNKTSDLFVPTNTSAEWTAFINAVTNSQVSSVSLAYTGCSCKSLLANGDTTSGLKNIDIDGAGPLGVTQVYCDMTTDGGGWTLIARSVSGATGTMGWTISRGAASDDTQPFSMGGTGITSLKFTQILFGNYTTGKTWGSNVYKHINIVNNYVTNGNGFYYSPLTNGFYTATGGCAGPVGGIAPVAVIGGNASFYMANLIGYTNRTDVYFFRDCQGTSIYGLGPSAWNTNYNTNQGGNINTLPGMIMVR